MTAQTKHQVKVGKKNKDMNQLSATSNVILNIVFILAVIITVAPIWVIIMASFTSEKALQTYGYGFWPQEWSTYVSKGKAGRYGVCFSWDVANIDNLTDWEPLPALTADTRNITPQNGSFTSGFGRGKCVVTAKASNPALVCAWLDQMYAPLQSPQNNWGTYGDETGFNIFEMSTNDKGEPMLKHAPLGDASPVEVREAQCVGGPLAVLDDYYGVYVTCPDDAQYRLDWIKDIYTPDMNKKYVYPNVFMSSEDTEQVSNLQADLQTYMNTQKANWIMNGTTDAEWNEYLDKLEAYGLSDYLAIMQKYLDAYYAEQ